MIGSTVAYLKSNGREVIYDAEHFFDGYKASRDFAMKTLDAAAKAGADILVLCDTNGGTMPGDVAERVADVRKTFGGIIGIHTHNDSEVAVANAITAIELGCSHVQGTVNGAHLGDLARTRIDDGESGMVILETVANDDRVVV